MDVLIRHAHLTEEDLLSLSEKVAENLAIAFDSLVQEVSDLKDRLQSSETEKESNLNSLKQKCDNLQIQLEISSGKIESLQTCITGMEDKIYRSNSERDELTKKLNDGLAISSELEITIRNLENDKEILSEKLTQMGSDLEKHISELKKFEEDRELTKKMKADAVLQIEDATTSKSLILLREKHMEESAESLRNHNIWLETQLHEANDKLLCIRRDNSDKLMALENELSARKSELANSQSTISKLEELVKNLTESNEDYIEKLKLRTDELFKLEQIHANELSSQKRLTDLFKEQSVDAENRIEEMKTAVSSMQDMLKSGHDHILSLQREKSSLEKHSLEEKNALLVKINNLSQELNASREIVDKFRIQGLSEEELRKLNPAVATTIASLKRGRSLTQIYSDYVQVVEERDLLKLDKDRLTEHVREMVSQLEEKGPLLRSQQEEFFKSKNIVVKLDQELKMLKSKLMENEKTCDDMKRRCGYFERQNLRLKQSCVDMSTQVKTLLREVELSRGTVIRTDPPLPLIPDSSSRSTMDGEIDSRRLLNVCISANRVIDENLVTYHDLSELQTQNQNLLLIARDLANQLEARESSDNVIADRVSELSAKVDVLSGEVNVSRLSAKEARSECELSKRQLANCMKVLAQHSISFSAIEMPRQEDRESFENPPLSDSTSDFEKVSADNLSMLVHPDTSKKLSLNKSVDQISIASPSVTKLEESICSIHSEFKQYREEKAKTDEVYTTTIEKLRKEHNEALIMNQKLASQLDFTHEKFRTLEANVANYKQEISILREMNARYTTSAAASDDMLTHLREETTRTAERLAASEVECRQLSRQLEHVRGNEARVVQELESLRKQNILHEQLMNQLQSIQSNLDHREEIDSRNTSRRISDLEEELKSVKANSAERLDVAISQNRTIQGELVFANQALKAAEDEVSILRSTLADQKKLYSIEKPLSSEQQTSQTNELVLIETTITSNRLKELDRECDALRISLEAARNQCDEYRALSSEMEDHVATLTKEREELSERYTVEFDEINQRCEFLEMQLSLEKKEHQDLVAENIRLTEDLHRNKTELQAELSSTLAELAEANERRRVALEVEEGAKSAVHEHSVAAQVAREKYERELTLHSQDVKLLMEARTLTDSAVAELNSLKLELVETNRKLADVDSTASTQNHLWDEERTQLLQRVGDADEEINRLQEKVIKLTEQIVGLRKLMEQSSCDPILSEKLEGQIKESNDFLHLIEYLRRQKSISEAAEETANNEVSRLHLRCKSLESRVADLQDKLAEERRSSEVKAETSRQHAHIMSQLEQISLLGESNRLFRQERETMRDSLQQSEFQLATLRSDIVPLRERVQELEDSKELLTSQMKSLEDERDRWKERCTRLVETTKRMDPEEYKQVCNERDELQRRLHSLQDAIACNEREADTKIATLNVQIIDLSSRLSTILAQQSSIESQLASAEAQGKKQKEELEKKQTNIIKLREIARKYRQETDELRRQLSETHAEEANFETANEAMVAAQADLINMRSNLDLEQERCSQLTQEMHELKQLLENAESHTANFTVIPTGADESIDSTVSGSTLQGIAITNNLYSRLKTLLSTLFSEITRLQLQADSQRERLLRMQLIESQLTKSKRENADLRAQLTSSPSVDLGTDTKSQLVSPPTIVDSSAPSSHTDVPTLPESILDLPGSHVSATDSSVTIFSSAPSIFGSSMTPHSWVMRATVQPVQTPTSATSFPTANSPSTISNRQTAEIRPITNNVATVLPTPTTPEQGSHLVVISEASTLHSTQSTFNPLTSLPLGLFSSIIPITTVCTVLDSVPSPCLPQQQQQASIQFINARSPNNKLQTVFRSTTGAAAASLFPSVVKRHFNELYPEASSSNDANSTSDVLQTEMNFFTEDNTLYPSNEISSVGNFKPIFERTSESDHQFDSEAKRLRSSFIPTEFLAPALTQTTQLATSSQFVSPMISNTIPTTLTGSDPIPSSSIEPIQTTMFEQNSPIEMVDAGEEILEVTDSSPLHDGMFQVTPPESADAEFAEENDELSAEHEEENYEVSQPTLHVPIYFTESYSPSKEQFDYEHSPVTIIPEEVAKFSSIEEDLSGSPHAAQAELLNFRTSHVEKVACGDVEDYGSEEPVDENEEEESDDQEQSDDAVVVLSSGEEEDLCADDVDCEDVIDEDELGDDGENAEEDASDYENGGDGNEHSDSRFWPESSGGEETKDSENYGNFDRPRSVDATLQEASRRESNADSAVTQTSLSSSKLFWSSQLNENSITSDTSASLAFTTQPLRGLFSTEVYPASSSSGLFSNVNSTSGGPVFASHLFGSAPSIGLFSPFASVVSSASLAVPSESRVSFSAAISKKKIEPIVWSENRNQPSDSSASGSLLRPSYDSLTGASRRKNWGSTGRLSSSIRGVRGGGPNVAR